MSKIKHITVTTTEQEIALGATYQFAWFRNNSDVDIIVSDHSGIVEDADDTEIIKSNDVGRITITNRDKVYAKAVSDTAKIDVHAQNYSDCPFKKQAKGGEEIDVIALNVTENDTYVAPSGTAYSPVVVNVSPSLPDTYEQLEYVTLNGYTGFVMLNYALAGGDIVEAYTAPFAESLSGEHAFFASSGYIEACYQDGNLTKWGNGCTDLIGSRPATANTKYLSRIQMTNTNQGFTIGYYSGSIYFFGRIYSLTIIRPSKDQSGTEVGSVKLLDFVPAKRKSDNKVGLYDMVNQVFCVSTTGTDFGEPT